MGRRVPLSTYFIIFTRERIHGRKCNWLVVNVMPVAVIGSQFTAKLDLRLRRPSVPPLVSSARAFHMEAPFVSALASPSA